MLLIPKGEHFFMEVEEKPRSKGRSQVEKVGRLKYNQLLLKRALRDLNDVKLVQRTILAGLKGLFHFEKPMIQKIAYLDEVDEEILELLYEARNAGMLPKDVATRLESFGIKRHHVSRRIQRMNKRVQKEIGETMIEKRGWHWVLKGFAFEVWGETEETKNFKAEREKLV